ncbi:hypothetical protein DFH06DRAFT_1473957 [Mycena polygramma]|nr:hypothetical protein DFH06DRAFT_1473957 [Mycena polygramma]
MDNIWDSFPKFTFLAPELDPPSVAEIKRRLGDNIMTDFSTCMLAILHEDAKLEEERAWTAAADAKAAKLKVQGNAAFVNKEFELAYIIYTACNILSIQNPIYSLNRAAVALKLKVYDVALSDASMTIEKADAGHGEGVKGFNLAKAYFRRGQARFHLLGDWEKAAEDYDSALALQPGDFEIVRGIKELKKLRRTTCPCDNNHAWIWQQGRVKMSDLFPSQKEFDRRVEVWMSGTTIAECCKRVGIEHKV